ncbi:MAG: HAD-IIIC family phosphatase [Planctomycetes bacterium]|nr:HAD-IIIC family phosphatase [Planctomycetota bacterium]
MCAVVLREAKRLRREGKTAEALSLLRRVLADGELPPPKLDAAGRFVQKAIAADQLESRVRVLVLGQATTSYLSLVLAALGWREGVAIELHEGDYDNVIQELLVTTEPPDVVVLLPWTQRLLASGERSSDERIADELAFWRQAWARVVALGSRLIQVGYDWVGPGSGGYASGDVLPLIRDADQALRAALPPGAFWVDLRALAGHHGRRSFYDARGYHWTKQPFSVEGLAWLAAHLWAGVRALTTGPKKVLVLDLDNTLWGGVVGEEGPEGVRVGGQDPEGAAYLAFQRHAKALSERGVVLAVCSKNNLADGREPFVVNPDMALALSDFGAFEASWDPKSVAIARIASTLRLGLDSFVFFDDNPVERAEVRAALPEVAVVDVPPDPADYVRALEEGLYFEAARFHEADRQRARQYQAEAQRREVHHEAISLDDYLTSLEMRGRASEIDEESLPRVIQLVGKTNQFNLTTRRHSEGEVRRILTTERSVHVALRLEDRFGDYGLIGVVLGVPHASEPRVLRLDTWLMSCRAIGRTVEDFTLDCIAHRARELGYAELEGEFFPTAKNAPVQDLFGRLGFRSEGDLDGGGLRFRLGLDEFTGATTFVQLAPLSPQA